MTADTFALAATWAAAEVTHFTVAMHPYACATCKAGAPGDGCPDWRILMDRKRELVEQIARLEGQE